MVRSPDAAKFMEVVFRKSRKAAEEMTKTAEPIQIGNVVFERSTGELHSPSGSMSLRPQTAKVLEILVESAGEMVGKQELMDRVWRDTHVTDDSLVQCISEIRKALHGASGVELNTIPKKGYRLSVFPPEEYAPTHMPSRGRRAIFLAVAITALMVLALIWSNFLLNRSGEAEKQTTIAVMPFLNMSGDDAQTYFSNGLSEDLIISLSNISDLRLLSRGASFSMSQSDQGIQEIARVLRADYVLEGSVRRLGGSLRVSAALVDGETGANVWANRFEGTTSDIFDFQDEVVEALVRTLSVRLSPSERERLGVHGTENVAAHDAYLRGRELENLYTRDTNYAAEAALLEAISIDPNYALAHAHLAQVYSFRVENNWTNEADRYIEAAFVSAGRAVELDPNLPFAHFSLGRLYTRSFSPDEERAAAAYETAIRLDPNYDDAYVFLANIHIFNGRAETALPLISKAFERNPLPPYWYYLAEGMSLYFLGNYEAAVASLVRARDQNPTAPYPYRFLIATYGWLGDTDEAEWMAMEYETLGRTATVEALLTSASIQDPNYRSAFAEGFRQAGLPEN